MSTALIVSGRPRLGQLCLPFSVLAGVVSGFYLPFDRSAPVFCVLILSVLAASPPSRHVVSRFRPLMISVACMVLGNLLTGYSLEQALGELPGADDLNRVYQVRARVLNYWKTRYGSAVKVDRIETISPETVPWELDRLTVYLPADAPTFSRNSQITAWIKLKRRWGTHPFPWPMRSLRERYFPQIVGTVKSVRLLDVIFQPKPRPANNLNRSNQELVDLFLGGEPSFIWRERLNPFGLGHLLAISGLHCVLVFLLIQFLLWPIRQPLLRFGLSALGIIAFAHWVGWTASVTRASLMLVLWQLLPHWGRKRSWLRLWFGLLIIALLANPLSFLMRGFWYSFAASLGLILGNRATKPSPLIHPWLNRIRPFLPIFSAQLFVIPINLMFDCHTMFTSFFWNLLGFFVLMIILVLFGICVIGLWFEPVAHFANFVEEPFGKVLNTLQYNPEFLSLTRFPHFPVMVLATLIVLAVILKYGMREIRWYAAATTLLFFSLGNRPLTGERLTMMDVGQGLCMLYTGPDGSGYLFDAGGTLPRGVSLQRILYLNGVRELKGAFISHLNADHYDLIPELKPDFPLWVPAGQESQFRQNPGLAGFEIKPIQRDFEIRLNNLRVLCLWPIPDRLGPNTNERSLVLHVKSGDWSMIMTGDAGIWSERRLPSFPVAETVILQVGHHGSKSATGIDFVNRLRPDIALISCGRENRFGHPHPDVLGRLREKNVTIFSTSDRGSIPIVIGNRTVFPLKGPSDPVLSEQRVKKPLRSDVQGGLMTIEQ